MSDRYDLVVVGGGIVGLATTLQLLRRLPDLRVLILEKEPEVAMHQSGHNSGVLHAGLYYVPGSLKARLCTEGKAALQAYATQKGIPFDLCGKLVVALNEGELGRFENLKARAIANNVPGIRDVGYMESFMGWELIYRTRQEMMDMSMKIPQAAISDIRIFTEENQHVIFLQLTMR